MKTTKRHFGNDSKTEEHQEQRRKTKKPTIVAMSILVLRESCQRRIQSTSVHKDSSASEQSTQTDYRLGRKMQETASNKNTPIEHEIQICSPTPHSTFQTTFLISQNLFYRVSHAQ